MHGVGRATAAITFVNALPTGSGCAAGVALPVEAVAEVEPVRTAGPGTIAIAPPADTPLVRATLLASLRAYSGGRDCSVSLLVRSQVPVARGLKSSSAVGSAVALAVANAFGAPADPEAASRLSAVVSREIGLSATGALDDALAATRGGIFVVDNGSARVLRHDTVPAEWSVVLWIPRAVHAPSPEWKERFEQRRNEARGAVESAVSGDYLAAMRRNTELVERVMGYDYRPLREELRRHGALASGVSGMGPTLASVVTAPNVSRVLAALPRGEGESLSVAFSPSGGGGSAR